MIVLIYKLFNKFRNPRIIKWIFKLLKTSYWKKYFYLVKGLENNQNDFFKLKQTIDKTFIIFKRMKKNGTTQVRCHVLCFCYVHNQIFLINTMIEHGIHAPYIFSLTCSIRINLIACHPWYVSLNWHATWTCQIFIPSHLRYNYLVNY